MSQIIPLPRPSDDDGLFLYFTGGLRAAKLNEGDWQIVPVLANGRPCATGPLTKEQLQALARKNKFQAVAFNRFSWTDGEYGSIFSPIIPGRQNHFEGPSQLWSNIARNIYRSRTKEVFEKAEHPEEQQIDKVFDDKSPDEALARYISLSLRSMDISVEQIAEFYFEQLVNDMAAGRTAGEKVANTSSQSLYAHVHSFFTQLGSARDYLAALIAYRLGFDPKKIDSLARLLNEIRQTHPPRDVLLSFLVSTGNIRPDPKKNTRLTASGWLREAGIIRDTLVHKRPYGSKSSERSGWIIPTEKETGLFRYFRPFELGGDAGQDLFDVLNHHYAKCTDLMYQAAIVSGYDNTMMHITDDDIINHTE